MITAVFRESEFLGFLRYVSAWCCFSSQTVITIKILNIRTPEKFAVITLKFGQGDFIVEYCIQRMQSDADGIANSVDPDQTAPLGAVWFGSALFAIANSVDPDQTAPLGAVWSGSALFAQTYLSENLGSLWYPGSLLTDLSGLICSMLLIVAWSVFLRICQGAWAVFHLSHIMRKPVYAIGEQQWCRSACTSGQSDQRLCCSLPG